MMLKISPDRGAHPAQSRSIRSRLDGRRGVCFVGGHVIFRSFALAARDPRKAGNHRHAPQRLPERSSPFGDRSRLRRAVHRKCGSIVLRRNSFAVEWAKVAGVSNNLHLTKRALDAGESARFLGVFSASAFFSVDGFAVSPPQRE